jgi:C4-dicarboxylate-specific signal transduction histidine kinase
MSVAFQIDGLLQEYFNDPSKQLILKKDEVLMDQGEPNRRLYLIQEGTLIGNVRDEDDNYYELFRSTKGMFVGVYSFFSRTYVSATRVIAQTDCQLAYIETDGLTVPDPEKYQKALEDAVQVVVHELAARQQLAHEESMQNRNTMNKLFEADKMATLGQMAAGLAHELNNAIMVLERNTDWLSCRIEELIQKRAPQYQAYYKSGTESAVPLSTAEVRERAGELQRKRKLERSLAKKLARTGIPTTQLLSENDAELGNLTQYWELGKAFNDMQLAAQHAIHVVKSVKQLGANRSDRQDGLQINETISEALGILTSALRTINMQTELGELPTIYGNHGEFVQVWINIIKNACEAMQQAGTTDPTILIKTKKRKKSIRITLQDNGPGIPKHIKAKIFQPSFTTKVGGLSFGLGLGLSIVQRLVSSYDGKVNVKSQPGETSFIIEIPYDYGKD